MLAIVLVVLFVNLRLRDSRLGRAWIALREDEVAAASMGVPLVKTKLTAYATGGAIGGIAGCVLRRLPQQRQRQPVRLRLLDLHPRHGHPRRAGEHLGRGARGACSLTFVNNRLIPDVLDQGAVNDLKNSLGLDFNFGEVAFGIFGFVLVLMMVLRPQGILPERRREMELTENPGEESVFEARA